MVEQEAPALLEGLPAMVRIGEAVVGPRADVQGPRFGGPLEEPPAGGGRHHLVAVRLGHARAGARPAGGSSRPRRRYLSLSLEAPMPWQATTQGQRPRPASGRWSTPATSAAPTVTRKRDSLTPRRGRRGGRY